MVQKTFRRAIVETDWARFEYYQRRIHQLGMANDVSRPQLETREVHMSVLRALTTYRPAKVFLPNLQRWMANHYAEDFLPFIDAFIGPNLKHAVMDFCGLPSNSQTEFHISIPLLSFARLSIDLQSLQFETWDPEGFYGPLFDLVRHLPNLRRLVVSPTTVDSEGLTYLGKLPFLEVLSEIILQRGDIPLLVTQNGRFPSLKELSFGVVNSTSATALLEVMRRPLESLSIDVSGDFEMDFSTRLALFKRMLSLLKQYHHSSLKKLIIGVLPAQHLSPRDQATIDAFVPLFACSSLQHLNMTTPFSQHLDDSWLAHATKFWPLLTDLEITDCHSAQETLGFTLKGLIPLIKGCPQLSELSLRLNLTPVAISLLDGVSNLHIQSIYAKTGSTLVRPHQVFRSLITMFPNITGLYWAGILPGAPQNNWKALRDLLRETWPVEDEEA